MRIARVSIIASCCLFAAAVLAWSQAGKPGLWETTSTMSWQQSPLPPGMTPPPNSPFGGGPHTSQVCVTQEMVDKYGGPLSPGRGDCQVTNVVKKVDGMTADLVCTGKMNGSAKIVSTWTDGGHAKSHVHFIGTLQMGPNTKPVEWSTDATSTYKGPDCGDVKPVVIPEK